MDTPTKSILLLRSGKLGDMIVITPLVDELKRQHPASRLTVVSSLTNEIIIRHNPFIDEILAINFHAIGDIFKAILLLRKRRFNFIIDCTPGYSTTNRFIIALGARGAQSIGWTEPNRPAFHNLRASQPDGHIIDYYLALGKSTLGTTIPQDPRPSVFAPAEHRLAAQKFFDSIKRPGTMVGVNLSAGHLARQWPLEKYRELVTLLCHDDRFCVVLFGIGPQREWKTRLTENQPRCTAAPDGDILLISELISRLDILISPDTSLIHIASSKKVAVVGLYGEENENFQRWKPYNVPSRILFSNSPDDLDSIESNDVYQKILELLYQISRNAFRKLRSEIKIGN